MKNKDYQNHNRISMAKLLNPQGLFYNLLLYSSLISLAFGFGVTIFCSVKNFSSYFRFHPSFSADFTSSPRYSSQPPRSAPPGSSPPPASPPSGFFLSPTSAALPPIQEKNSSTSAMHNLTDEELFRRAAAAPRTSDSKGKHPPKVAFMFLTRGKLPLAPLWEKFFEGHESLFTIYIHTSDPTFVDDTPETSPFYGRRIPSKEVEWGKNSMVEAELRLLANALLDSSNQRFVLLSESGIPLFNFTIIYEYLINSEKSYVEVYDLPGPAGRGRYSHHMLPLITRSQWRKGSQWFEMSRDLALEVVSDREYFLIFKQNCKARCYSDEHYLPTFVDIKFKEKNSNRTLTWTDWSHRGSHPRMFRRTYVTAGLLQRLRNDSKTCEYNGKKSEMCFLFARKFHPDALNRLLLLAPNIMHF